MPVGYCALRGLLSYNERVEHALQKLLASRVWTGPQRDWLKRIAAQTKANLLVDHAAIDDPELIFKREGGGFTRKSITEIFPLQGGRDCLAL